MVVWQESLNLVKDIYRIIKNFPSEEKFGLISQLRRATVSISYILAKETSKTTNKDKAHFTNIACSSAMEVLNQLIISKKLGFISENETIIARQKIEKITNMLNVLRNSQVNTEISSAFRDKYINQSTNKLNFYLSFSKNLKVSLQQF